MCWILGLGLSIGPGSRCGFLVESSGSAASGTRRSFEIEVLKPELWVNVSAAAPRRESCSSFRSYRALLP